MDLSLGADQLSLRGAFAELFGKEASSERVRAAEERGHDDALWRTLVAAGAPTMGVSEELGGGGAGTADLVVVAIEAGRRVAPVPLVEALAAADALARAGARDLLDGAGEGRVLPVLAPRPLRAGSAGPVSGAAVADVVVALDGDELVALSRPEGTAARLLPNLGSAALAEVTTAAWSRRTVLAIGEQARTAHAAALSLLRVLTAAALEGVRQEALRLGVDYVKERHAFGVPIGWFQTVQHRLADVATAGDGAELLVHEAAWARDTGDPRAGALARMALLFAAGTAQQTTAASLHFHGGYGYTLEYDVQLYHRRATAWPLALGAPRHELRALAADLFGPDSEARGLVRGTAPSVRGVGRTRSSPDFTEHDSLAAFRAAAAAWADRHVRPEWAELEHATGTHHNPELHALLGQQGLLGAGWPAEYGGTDVDPGYALAVFQEIGARGLRMDGWITTEMVARTILAVATEEAKREIVPAALRGEVVIVLGYTEPGSGSDVAAASMRAVRDGDEWVVNGSKMFTSTAHVATHVFLLTRTNPEVAKHKGLTLLLARLDAPGVEVQPVHTLGGQRTNATFYSDVRVPDRMRIGDVDGGWGVMRVALVHERGTAVAPGGPTLVERVAAWARETPGDDGAPLLDDPTVAESLARLAVDDEVARLLGLRVRWVASTGGMPGVEGSMAKLFSSEAEQRRVAVLTGLLGERALLREGPLRGDVEEAFRKAPVSTIYGGTSEVQREIVAERRLGLPRSRPAG
ncbi:MULTISPECIES: acyl-CoA dehydrogenase [unclassified Blastococcus]